MNWRLNATTINTPDKIILYGKQSLSISTSKITKLLKTFLSELSEGLDSERIEMYSKNPIIESIMHRMKENNLIVPYTEEYIGTPQEKSYDFYCHYLSKHDSQLKFNSDRHITILGCGGVGANIAQNLIVSGFENYTLVDFDVVQPSNLNRQLPFTASDIGKSKTEVLSQYLLSKSPSARVKNIDLSVNSKNTLVEHLGETDLIVAGIDSPPVLSSIYAAEYALENNVPIIFGAAGYDTIKIGPFLTSNHSIQKYINYLKSINITSSTPIRGSLCSTNSLLTSIMSNDIINYFYKMREMNCLNKQIILDPFTLTKISENSYENI